MSLKLENLSKDLPKGLLLLLPDAFERFNINGPLRASHFLGQVSHESGNFKSKTESLIYSTAKRIVDIWPSRFNLTGTGGKKNANDFVRNQEKLANEVYGGRMGNNQPGDGFRFRGGGFLQLTGRDMYKKYADYIKKPVEETADLVRTDDYYALDSALWVFCIEKKLNSVADKGVDLPTITTISKRINGGTIGLDDRVAKTTKFHKLLS